MAWGTGLKSNARHDADAEIDVVRRIWIEVNEIAFVDVSAAGRAFEPQRSRRYRDGDHEYDNRYGSHDAYKREYRSAFQQGYDEGFRGVRR